jgi:phosphatidylethanolamine-binding protein (PEBP) family uncharacterized protein
MAVNHAPITVIVLSLIRRYIFAMINLGLFMRNNRRGSLWPPLPDATHRNSPAGSMNSLPLCITSVAFPPGGLIPSFYRFSGANCNPPLRIKGLPKQTRSLLVVLEQRDTPIAPRTHWVCWDIPPSHEIVAKEQRGIQGKNDFLHIGYTGPLSQNMPASFCFLVFALRSSIFFREGSFRYQVQRSIASGLLAVGELPFFA